MRKGVIRPRQFAAPPSPSAPARSHSGYENGKFGKPGGGRRALALIVVAVTLLLAFVLLSGGGGASDGARVGPAGQKLARQGGVRGMLADGDEEDEEDDDERAPPARDAGASDDDEDDDESDDDGEDEDADAASADDEANSADAERGDDDDDDDDDDDGRDGADDPEASEEAQRAVEREERAEIAEDAPPAFAGADDKRMTIDEYFISLGRRAVNVAPSGSYKFVLVHARDRTGAGAYLVQGCSARAPDCKHSDAARLVRHPLAKHGLSGAVLGGGRITRHRLTKSDKKGLISIFGYSRSYGRCADCNRKACDFVAAAFPGHVVRWSNEGYLESDEGKIRHSFVKCSAP